MNVLAQQRETLAQALHDALQRAQAAGRLRVAGVPEIALEVPPKKEHGDFATNLPMLLAREAGKSPRQIAEILVESLETAGTPVADVAVAGPGFINFRLHRAWLSQVLRAIAAAGPAYGQSRIGEGKRVQVEFVSANPTGPLNVVNARAAAVGDCLANLLAAVGYQVAREFYVNDAGRQADLFGQSLEARYRELAGEPAEIPEGGYPGEYVIELARQLREERPDLLALPEAERRAFLRTWGPDRVVEWQRADLLAFGVRFDRWFRERELHAGGAVEELIAALRAQGDVYESEGALWLASTRFGDDKDRVLVRGDGTPTYIAGDGAYHRDKFQRGFDKVIDIWGPDHHGYVARTKALVQALGYPADALEILILQFVTLLRRGEKVKMSKRGGEFVGMADLLEEVGRDAARYFFLMRSPESHLDFDLELAQAQSAENPVYYVQYAHARICSLLREAEAQGADMPPAPSARLDLLDSPYESDLIRKLADFPDEVLRAAAERGPHHVARYALELAQVFHVFYTQCRVLGSQPDVQGARLVLAQCTRTVLANALALMGIKAPESM